MNPKDKFYLLSETNDWEGETWYHYFLAEPGVKKSIESAIQVLGEESDFEEIKEVDLSDEEQTTLANLEPGYMDIHWFGELDIEKLKGATREDLYKGGIREYGESLFEQTIVTAF